MGGRRLLFEKALDVLFGRLVEQRLRAAPAAILEDAHPSFTPSETLDARIDGGSGAVEGPGDLSGREAIGGKQRYVHPQPTTGFRLALHLADKVLALLGGEDDTLHGRSSLWWLDGFGVFTMPQGTAVCSIILCIYLVEVLHKAGVQAVNRPVPASSLSLPDAARVRLLAELGGLLRVYCAETLGNLPSASKLRSKLEGTGYNSLALVTADWQEFLAVYVSLGDEEAHKTLSVTEVAGLLKNAGQAAEADAASASDRILELLTFEEEPKAYNNRGLFSDDYLEHRVLEGAEWAEDVSAAYKGFREMYEDKKDDLAGLDEANTEMEFVEPALALLGFHPIKRAKTKTGAIPDYALFGSAEDKNTASNLKKDSEGFYARTLAVVEGKYWGRSLDVYTKTLSENFPLDLEQRRISPRMDLPIVSVLKGDAPCERGYHNQERGLLPPSSPSVEETQEMPAQKEEEEYERRQAEGP